MTRPWEDDGVQLEDVWFTEGSVAARLVGWDTGSWASTENLDHYLRALAVVLDPVDDEASVPERGQMILVIEPDQAMELAARLLVTFGDLKRLAYFRKLMQGRTADIPKGPSPP